MYVAQFPFYFFNVFAHMFFYFYFCISPFKKDYRFKKWATALISCAVVALFCIFDIVFFEKGAPLFAYRNSVPFLTLIFLVGYGMLVVKKHYFQLIFIVIVCFTAHMGLSIVANSLCFYFPMPTIMAWFPQFNNLIVQLIILAVCAYPMWYMSAKLFSKVNDNGIDFMQWKLTVLLPIALFVMTLLFEAFAMNKTGNGFGEVAIEILFVVATYLTFFCILKIMLVSDEKHTAQQKAEQAQKQIEFAKSSFTQLADNIAATERERHDFRHHYVAIRDIVNCGDIQKAQEYFNQYDSAYPLRKPLLVCHNAMLNAILSHYLDNATQGGVKVTCAVNIPQAIGIDTLELGVVMGNLVENAVEATLRQGDAADRFVDIKTNIVGQQLVAIIANSYDGRIKNENGEYLSSKRISKVGIGIDSVKKLVAKNGGNLKIEYDEKVFTAAVALNIC